MRRDPAIVPPVEMSCPPWVSPINDFNDSMLANRLRGRPQNYNSEPARRVDMMVCEALRHTHDLIVGFINRFLNDASIFRPRQH